MEAPDPPGDRDGEGDTVDHLWNAAHEMLRAMRTLLDAAEEFGESQRGGGATARAREPREGRVHHIDIDARADPDADAS
jgi:hypothetical protein